MSFMEKMKSGLNQVKDKAQQTVEATRISSQISSKKKDRAVMYEQLGQFVHQAQLAGTLTDQLDRVQEASNSILQINADIAGLEEQLLMVKGERVCACGATVSYESKFCNSCGQPMQLVPPPYAAPPAPPAPAAKVCPNCQAAIDADSRFCVECGHKSD